MKKSISNVVMLATCMVGCLALAALKGPAGLATGLVVTALVYSMSKMETPDKN